MGAFDSSFDAAAFDADGGSGALGTGSASLALSISVVDPQVFDDGQVRLKWAVEAMIGAVDVSARMTGSVKVVAGEDSARVATFQVVPLSVAEMDGYEGQVVTIDVQVLSGAYAARYRIFTGVVEVASPYDPVRRMATIVCRDGYQERIKACTTAAAVEALFGGLATPNVKIVPWSDVAPDPVSYFTELQATMMGCCTIDASGLWRAIPWSIGAPAVTFGPGGLVYGSLAVRRAERHALPTDIHATLVHRYPRLHAAELETTWDALERVRYVVDGVERLTKSTVESAIASVSDWHVKGQALMVEPVPGTYPVIVGPTTHTYVLDYSVAAISVEHLEITWYRRWYQEAEVTYSVTIPMGGLSGRDDVYSATITSDFDASAWEEVPSAASANGLYQANAPVVPTPPTGYEGLPEPWPPANGAIDHHADISPADLDACVSHVVARALHKATAARREQSVTFTRAIDPRWEIGAVLGVDAFGVQAVGQVVDIEHELDKSSGRATTTLRLACPDGDGTVTAFTASAVPPSPPVTHGLTAPVLGNHIGANFDTPPAPDEDSLNGFLCNTLPTSTNYDASAPVYEPQFRFVLPEIADAVRDPLLVEQAITATISIAGSGITVSI